MQKVSWINCYTTMFDADEELPGIPGIRKADGAAGQLGLDKLLGKLALWRRVLKELKREEGSQATRYCGGEFHATCHLIAGKRLNIQPEVVPSARSVYRSSPSVEMQCFATKSLIEKLGSTNSIE